MSHSPVNVWSTGDKLTSAQATQMAEDISESADKTSAGDTISGAWVMSNAGRVVPTSTNGANANTNYTASGGNSEIRVTSAVTASRNYTLTASGSPQAGDKIVIWCDSSFSSSYTITVKDQAAATLCTLGNNDTADGAWAEFSYQSGWKLMSIVNARLKTQTFTGNGTFNVPRGVTRVFVTCSGAGGGGGGGGGGDTTNGGGGGGGGGGAKVVAAWVGVTAEEAIVVTIGTGGAGGAVGSAGVAGSDGSNGGNTTFGSYLTAYGAMGGGGGLAMAAGAITYSKAGGPRHGQTRQTTYGVWRETGTGGSGWRCDGGTLGAASGLDTAGNGTASSNGGSGGVGGTVVLGVTYYGGGGGGGGAGEFPGATGGDGGRGGSSGAGVAGSVGLLGAGGGGGGGGGVAGGGGGAGGLGGDGGPGVLTVGWVK